MQNLAGGGGVVLFVWLLPQAQIHTVRRSILRGLPQNFAKKKTSGREMLQLWIKGRLVVEPFPSKPETVIPGYGLVPELECAERQPTVLRKKSRKLRQKTSALAAN